MSDRAHCGQIAPRPALAATVVVAAALTAGALAPSALAQPPVSCSPAAMMNAQADEMNELADFVRNHPDASNTNNPADAADALQMAAALRRIQANMVQSCGLTMDQAMNPGPTPAAPGH